MSDAIEARFRAELAAGDLKAAATTLLRAYGSQILRYLRSLLRDEAASDEVFARFAEQLWKALPSFRDESSALTWAHGIAWNCAHRFLGDPYRKRQRSLESAQLSALVDVVRSGTKPFLKTEVKSAVARLRESLDPEERTLIYLRVDRKMSWKDAARVLQETTPNVSEAGLRKRFERIKDKLRVLAEEHGLTKR